MKKRLCIYIIFDKEKRIDKYIQTVLKGIRKHVSSVVVVCNFESAVSGLEYITDYADEILYRENKGYDSGAYKDAIEYLGDVLETYDELLLANDTFYGPFDSFDDMFKRMDEDECDYWGITRHPAGRWTDGYLYNSHIQSYFIVYKERILRSSDFANFWCDLKYPMSYEEAIINYEFALNQYFAEKNFVGKAYMDFVALEYSYQYSQNPCIVNAYELIKDYGIPILKRRSLDFNNQGCANAIKALGYIRDNTRYNYLLILEHIKRLQNVKTFIPTFEFVELEKFVAKHKKIYIYGNGCCGKAIAAFFSFNNWGYVCHVVTDNSNEDCKMFSEIDVEDQDGIVIAINNREAIDEVYHNVRMRCKEEQIFKPNYSDLLGLQVQGDRYDRTTISK